MKDLTILVAIALCSGLILSACNRYHPPISETAYKRVSSIPVENDPLLNTTAGRVTFRLAHHKLFAGNYLSVTESAGVVFLNGAVNSKIERALAERVAKDTTGVNILRNNLKISGFANQESIPSKISDNNIEEIVMKIFFISKSLKGTVLSAESNNGHVKITGTASKPGIDIIAQEMVENIIGVESAET